MVQRDDDARVARRGCVKIRFAELQTTRAREQLALIFFMLQLGLSYCDQRPEFTIAPLS